MNELIVISSLISILFLLVLFLWLIPGYRVDLFRQQMFALRDELFDEARKGNISFSDPAYGMLRSSMNGFIQFGHRLNVWQVMLLNFIARNEKNRMTKPFYKQLEENMTENTPEQKELIKSYYLRMNYCVTKHLINSSYILMITLFVPLIFYFFIRLHIEIVTRLYKGYLDKIDTAALANGEAK